MNGGEWSDGIDLNLMNGLKKAPLNLVVSMPSEMDYGPELVLSRAGYFTQWENVPKEPIFLKLRDPVNAGEQQAVDDKDLEDDRAVFQDDGTDLALADDTEGEVAIIGDSATDELSPEEIV